MLEGINYFTWSKTNPDLICHSLEIGDTITNSRRRVDYWSTVRDLVARHHHAERLPPIARERPFVSDLDRIGAGRDI